MRTKLLTSRGTFQWMVINAYQDIPLNKLLCPLFLCSRRAPTYDRADPLPAKTKYFLANFSFGLTFCSTGTLDLSMKLNTFWPGMSRLRLSVPFSTAFHSLYGYSFWLFFSSFLVYLGASLHRLVFILNWLLIIRTIALDHFLLNSDFSLR